MIGYLIGIGLVITLAIMVAMLFGIFLFLINLIFPEKSFGEDLDSEI